MELLRQLASRLAAADDEHGAGRKRGWIRIVLSEELGQGCRQLFGARRSVCALVRTRRDDHSAGPNPFVLQVQDECVAVSFERRHLAVGLHGGVERIGPSLEVINQFRQRHESIRVGPGVLGARELDAPVGSHEAERIPASRAPGLGDAPGLEDDVVDVGLLQVPAGGQAGLAGPDDRNLNAFSHLGRNLSPALSSESVKISDVQAGRIGEFLLAVYAMLTSDGELVPFQVDADDDHRDLVVAAKGKSTFASLQAKACFGLGASGFVQSNATYFESSIPRDPSWIYVVVLVLELAPVVWWLVPAPDFNRLTTQSPARGGCWSRSRTSARAGRSRVP